MRAKGLIDLIVHEMSVSNYRWVIVAAGSVLGCIAIGAMFSLPVLLTR